MIRIARPAAAPARLASHGAPDMAQIFTLFDADPHKYSSGSATLPFKTAIYGHQSVKNALRRAQHDKCCYCEGVFHGYAAGDVEHFRPKAYSQQDPAGAKHYPGYYWLAYRWDNLLFSCQTCNRSHKRNLFPLSNQARRARRRSDRIGAEQPLLIDPCGPDDPRDHIAFHQEVPKGITRRGKVTVEVLKLDRPDLNDRRCEHLNQLKALSAFIRLQATSADPNAVQIVTEARQFLDEAKQAKGIFSSMARDFIEPR